MAKQQQQSAVAERQAPLRTTYANNGGEAISVKRVLTVETPTTDVWHGTVAADGFPGVAWEYGIDTKVGGYDDLPNPGHLLCAALAACMESTVRMIADHLRVGINHLEVEVVGDADVRGCLAMDSSIRSGFRKLRCEIRIEPSGEVNERLMQTVLDQAERLCVTLDTLRNGVPIEVSAEIATPAVAPA